MNILVSNDDGINANGLRELVKELSRLGDVYVVAPDSERSANSHHFTLSGRLKIEEREIEGAKKAYALWGTPSDCVHAGILYLIENVDLVVSGINQGWNVSSDLIYSGTVAAARQAFMENIPSIAFSFNSYTKKDFRLPARLAKIITEKYIREPHNRDYFLNVNFPDLPLEEIKGMKACGTYGKIFYDEHYEIESEDGVDYLRIHGADMRYDFDTTDMDIDINALEAGYITITPLYNNHINHDFLNEVYDKWHDFNHKQ